MSDPAAEDTSALEAELVARVARQDREAFAQLYDRFSRPLYATALRILNDAKEAEDVMHDVFITVWEKAGLYAADRGNVFSWIVTLTRNKAIDRQRARVRRADLLAQAPAEDLPLPSAPADDDLGGGLILQERAVAVRAAVQTLPAEQRQALELAFFSGLTQQEISTRLGQPLGTVKARIRRGLLKLRDQLEARV